MQKPNGNHIASSIQKLYCKRLAAPFFYLLFIGVFLSFPQVSSALSPAKLTSLTEMEQLYRQEKPYGYATLKNLKFTGYTKTRFHRTEGYFYYIIAPGEQQCHIVLLSASACGQGQKELPEVCIYGKILPKDSSYQSLLSCLADDLSWTDDGILSQVNTCYFSEPDFRHSAWVCLLVLLAASGAFALVSLLVCLLFVFRPDFAPPCRMLKDFGSPKELLAMAEEELATQPQLATEDLFITEHFFIELSRYGTALVPISEIIWIYKHSTLHKLFGYHFHISYTLHIIANRHIRIHCPKNIKSDIDGIMDYLTEANHGILAGFTKENKTKAYEALAAHRRKT